jgi:uncharacterized oxidoreductase
MRWRRCAKLWGAPVRRTTTHQDTLQESVDAIFNCMTTLILNPEMFAAPDMQQQTHAFVEWVKQSPHSHDELILVPGEWEENNRRLRKAGIPLDPGSWQGICAAAVRAGMPQEEVDRLQR